MNEDRRIKLMTTEEIRQCVDAWQSKIESGKIPLDKKEAAARQLQQYRMHLENRKKEGRLIRTFKGKPMERAEIDSRIVQ